MSLSHTLINGKKNPVTQQAQGGLATILAIGTATPSNHIYQADYPDYYFRVTNSDHMVDLKAKFKRMCDKSMIRKRHLLLTEEYLKQNPNMYHRDNYTFPSLNARQDLVIPGIPKLAKEAADNAIDEWGLPRSKITHLIFCTTSGVDLPGADFQLTKLLGLSPSVNRLMLYHQGCAGGGVVLRIAKDLCENNKGSRVLVVCCETTVGLFHGPNEKYLDGLLVQALFGDGAAAMIVGSNPDFLTETSLFQIVSANQTIIPNSEHVMRVHLRESGLTGRLDKDIPKVISENIEDVIMENTSSLVISDWNSLFWIVHPGGRSVLDQMEVKLNLREEKLKASRHVLSEYGNMAGASVFFVMDEMRKKSAEERKSTTGEGLDWGVLIGFGPGVTVETVVLRSIPASTPLLD